MLRDRDEAVIEAAHRSLVVLTRQDFGVETRAWVDWWERNRHRHRVEWLIDGLVHGNGSIRAAAGLELEALTGFNFGYDPQLSAPQREEIRKRFLVWWADSGLLDFGRFG